MNAAQTKIASLLLRIGLAFVFLYAAAAAFVEPDAWIGYLPTFLQQLVPGNVLLIGFSIIEILVALWLLSGKFLFYSALLAALMFAGIIITNFGIMDVVFRDVAIFFSALALASLGRSA